jgi:hypothetical protein
MPLANQKAKVAALGMAMPEETAGQWRLGMTGAAGSRRVVLKGAPARPAGWRLWRSLWAAGALAAYAGVTFVGWPLLERRSLDLNMITAAGEPTTPALMQTGLAFGAFGLVALVAIALCWRRRGIARIAVLSWPLVMLGIPEVARFLPGPWIWLGCLVLGVLGAALIAGPDHRR